MEKEIAFVLFLWHCYCNGSPVENARRGERPVFVPGTGLGSFRTGEGDQEKRRTRRRRRRMRKRKKKKKAKEEKEIAVVLFLRHCYCNGDCFRFLLQPIYATTSILSLYFKQNCLSFISKNCSLFQHRAWSEQWPGFRAAIIYYHEEVHDISKNCSLFQHRSRAVPVFLSLSFSLSLSL